MTMIPGILSALQVNQTVKHVELEVTSNVAAATDVAAARHELVNFWKWVSYALFSSDAGHNLETVSICAKFLDEAPFEAIDGILKTPEPLAALFDTGTTTSQSISAVCVTLSDPRITTESDDLPLYELPVPVYRTPQPQSLRVVDSFNGGDDKWWSVLLPGYGVAWVRNDHMIGAPPLVRTRETTPHNCPAPQLRFTNVDPTNSASVLAFLGLLGAGVQGVKIDNGSREIIFDITTWVVRALYCCPKLKRLHLPLNAKICDLQILANAANASQFSLRSLKLGCVYDSEASSIIEFMKVFSNMPHPLTRRLEYPHFSVIEGHDASADFREAWMGMLQSHRRLCTISPAFQAPRPMEETHEAVEVRTGPLAMKSKLAFLSILRDPSQADHAVSQMDVSVISIIFEFAAERGFRQINIGV